MLLRSLLSLSLLCSFVPLTACGVSVKHEDDAPNVQQPTFDAAFADHYFIDDPSCQTTSGVGSLGAVPIHRWQGAASEEVPFDFQSASGSSSLKGPGILGSLYDFHQQSACGAVGDDSTCGGAKVVAEAAPLHICKAQGPYARTSVEGVALASLANLSAAYNYYQTIPNKKTLLRADMLVLPTIEKTYDDGQHSVATDNLAYAPSFGGSPVFVIYPKGARAEKLGLWKDLNLWELPWGLAHEFGHHVFRTHSGLDESSSMLPIHTFPDDSESTLRSVTGKTVIGAVNEGYADLFAYYVYGSKPGLTAGVDCFEGNRDVAAAEFANGQDKVLTSDILATFFSTTTVKASSNCRIPSFQDIHAVGAIVAHGVDGVFSAVAGKDGDAAALKKAQLLLTWAEHIGTVVTDVGAANVTFEALIKEALLAAAGSGQLSADACTAARTAFPEYMAGWQSGGISCSN